MWVDFVKMMKNTAINQQVQSGETTCEMNVGRHAITVVEVSSIVLSNVNHDFKT